MIMVETVWQQCTDRYQGVCKTVIAPRNQLSPLPPTIMTSLPSFVDLMASLGLEQKEYASSKSTSSPHLTPPASPFMARRYSTPFLRNSTIQKQRICRFSPYSMVDVRTYNLFPNNTISTLQQPPKRRGNLSSTPTPEPEQMIRVRFQLHDNPIR